MCDLANLANATRANVQSELQYLVPGTRYIYLNLQHQRYCCNTTTRYHVPGIYNRNTARELSTHTGIHGKTGTTERYGTARYPGTGNVYRGTCRYGTGSAMLYLVPYCTLLLYTGTGTGIDNWVSNFDLGNTETGIDNNFDRRQGYVLIAQFTPDNRGGF